MAMWDGGSQATSPRRSAAQPRHLGGGAGLVDEDQALRIEVQLAVEPCTTPRKDVGTLLLRCMG